MMDNQNTLKKSDVELDAPDILRNITKNIWLIILCALTASMWAYMLADLLYKPTYESSATFVVTSKGYNNIYMNLEAANTVAETMTGIFSSEILEKKVAGELGWTSLPGKVKAKVIDETNLFELTVTSSSPDKALRIIHSIIDNYASVTSDVFDNAILSVLEAPELPMYPNNRINIIRIMQLAFLAGIAVMTALIAGISILKDDIKNENDVIKKLDTKLFGVIYHEKKYKTFRSRIRRKKKSILITSPTVSFSFIESIQKIRAKFEYKASRLGHNVLLVTSVLENEGKSTIAANLAISLARKGMDILLIDADLYNPSIYKILNKDMIGGQEFKECLTKTSDIKKSLIYDESSGLHLLLGMKYCRDSKDLLTQDSLQKLINKAKGIMDYVIIDAPPITISADAELLADVADMSLLVIRQGMASAKSINEAIEVLAASKSELLGGVFTNVHKSLAGYRLDYGSKYLNKQYYGYYKKRLPDQET